MTSIDRGDSHYEDAGSWSAACRHIGWFLLWAARRGLANDDHQSRLEALAGDPGEYVLGICDGKLIPLDLTDDGNEFATRYYDAYLGYLSDYSRGLNTTPYAVTDSKAAREGIFGFLDHAYSAA